MIQTLIDLLKTLDLNVYQQGSFTKTEDYDDHFFTFWNDDSYGTRFYDNKEIRTGWRFTIYYYATDPAVCLDMILKAKDLLIKNGWIVSGKGRDIASDSEYHSGRMIEIYFIEKNKEV